MTVDQLANITEQKRLLRELYGEICRCGGSKVSKQTFCRGCYMSLPRDVRLMLYQRIGAGYENAYAEAVRFLDAKS